MQKKNHYWKSRAEAQRDAFTFVKAYDEMGDQMIPKYLQGIISTIKHSAYRYVNDFMEFVTNKRPESLKMLRGVNEVKEEE